MKLLYRNRNERDIKGVVNGIRPKDTKPLWTESPEVSKGMKFPAYSSIIALVS